MNIEFSEGCKNLKNFNPCKIEESVENIFGQFPELADTSSILYFFHGPNSYQNWPPWKGVATFFPLDFPKTHLRMDYPQLYRLVREKYPAHNYAFHLTRIITEGDEITRTINISHEFQHASQYKENKKHYYLSRIIHNFLSDNVIEEENIPTEYDAIRKSKIVANELCEKSEVERYIQRKILELEGTKYFWIKTKCERW